MPTLPFLTTGDVQELDGTVVTSEVGITLWPVTGRGARTGQQFDHEGEADITAWSSLSGRNRSVEVDGVVYRIVSAQKQDFLPHVWLILRRMVSGGEA